MIGKFAKGKATFSISADDYVLVYQPDMRYDQTDEKVWTLNYLIDRSYKGKDPDVGGEVMYLTDEQAKELKVADFRMLETYTPRKRTFKTMRKSVILQQIDQLMGAGESIHTVTLFWRVVVVSSNKISRCVRRHKRCTIHQAVSSVAPSVYQYYRIQKRKVAALLFAPSFTGYNQGII